GEGRTRDDHRIESSLARYLLDIEARQGRVLSGLRMRPDFLRISRRRVHMESALAAFLLAIPSVIGALLILIVGWIIAGWVGRLVAQALRMVRLNAVAD